MHDADGAAGYTFHAVFALVVFSLSIIEPRACSLHRGAPVLFLQPACQEQLQSHPILSQLSICIILASGHPFFPHEHKAEPCRRVFSALLVWKSVGGRGDGRTPRLGLFNSQNVSGYMSGGMEVGRQAGAMTRGEEAA